MALYVLDTAGEVKAFIESYTKLEWERPYRRAGKFTMEINRNIPEATNITKGRFLAPRDEFFSRDIDQVYFIEQVEQVIDQSGAVSEMLKVSGRSYGGMLEERLCLPDASGYDSQTDPVETLMKHYVTANAGSGATANRQLPNFTVATDLGNGTTRTYDARYQTVAEVLEELSIIEEYGWQVTYDEGTNQYEFDVIIGTDKSATVFFDITFDTILSQKYLSTDLERKTYAYVGGQGEGNARTIEEVYIEASEPTGLDRRELWVDSRDQDSTNGLISRGSAKLSETREADVFKVTINKYGSFRYREDYDLGDYITLKNDKWGVEQSAQIVGITISIDNSLNSSIITAELERTYPDNLAKKIKEGRRESGTARS